MEEQNHLENSIEFSSRVYFTNFNWAGTGLLTRNKGVNYKVLWSVRTVHTPSFILDPLFQNAVCLRNGTLKWSN